MTIASSSETQQVYTGTTIERLMAMVDRHASGIVMVETREAHNLEVAGSNPVPATSFHVSIICPVCNGGCVMIFDCSECDFVGCGNCFDKHSHSSDSEVAQERYRDQLPKTSSQLPKTADKFGSCETTTGADASPGNRLAVQCAVKRTISPAVFGSRAPSDEAPEGEQLPRVIRIDQSRERQGREVKPPRVPMGTCARCQQFPCVCSPFAASEDRP
jgi:hypothetical protein